MPLQSESFIRIYRGTRRLGGGRPVIVVTVDTMDATAPMAEYFIFHEFPDMPFLYSRATCTHADSLYLYDFGQYPEVFSAAVLLQAQFRAAQDRLEHEVAMRDKPAGSDIFYSATSIQYEETDNLPLVEFAIFQRFPRERDQMFKFSKSHALSLLKEKLLELPEAVLNVEPVIKT